MRTAVSSSQPTAIWKDPSLCKLFTLLVSKFYCWLVMLMFCFSQDLYENLQYYVDTAFPVDKIKFYLSIYLVLSGRGSHGAWSTGIEGGAVQLSWTMGHLRQTWD